MKKGAFGNLGCIYVLLPVLMLISAASVAALITDAPASDDTSTFDWGATTFQADNTARGYWVLTTIDTAGVTHERYYNELSAVDSLLPSPYTTLDEYFGNTPALYPSTGAALITQKTDGALWELNYATIYPDFDIPEPYTEEALTLKFILDPYSFKKGGDIKPSHGSSQVKFADYASDPCLLCDVIDDVDSCAASTFGPNSCIKINLLPRADCSVLGDYAQPYCEGVEGVPPNVDSNLGSSETSKPGFGGCRIFDQDGLDTSMARESGRDWFSERPTDLTEDAFSDDFDSTHKTEIGWCCGNDDLDAGAIMRYSTHATTYPNAYACFNDSRENEHGNFRWANARTTEFIYKIITAENPGVAKFDLVSNSNNWFACDLGAGQTLNSGLYSYEWATTGTDGRWDNGILIPEYGKLPMPKGTIIEGTDVLPGSGPSGFDTAVASAGAPSFDDPAASSDQIVDEDSFVNDDFRITGVGAISACDHDGDGYDGPYTTGYFPEMIHVDYTDCESPREPFDCDDDPDSAVSRIKHPGAPDYCVDGNPENLDCNEATPCTNPPTTNTPDMLFSNPSASDLIPRFICHNVDAAGEFAECCGWDLTYCFNPEKGRREGSAVHTLREFNNYREVATVSNPLLNKTNFILRYGVNYPGDDFVTGGYSTDDTDELPPYGTYVPEDATYRIALFDDNHDNQIQHWNEYETLEFYIWFTANFEADIWVGYFLGDPMADDPLADVDLYAFPFQARILDYVVNEPQLQKWLHVVIPINHIFPTAYDPEIIVFASNARRVIDVGTKVEVNIDGSERTFSNIIGIDKIFLRPRYSDISSHDAGDYAAENFYCSGTWPPIWITNLDDNTKLSGEPKGESACNSIPSYAWTGTMCCGDDTGNTTSPSVIGPLTFQERYNDTANACFGGNLLANGERMMLVTYNLTYLGFNDEVPRMCRTDSCLYELPPGMSTLVRNEHPEVYDLAFVSSSGGYIPIGAGALAPLDAYIRADKVPLQMLFLDGEFLTCNGEDYIHALKNTMSNQPLIRDSPDTRLTSYGDFCATAGKYFCDHEDGENAGWSNEFVLKYPLSLNISKYEDEVYEIPDDEQLRVNATYRVNLKKNYNLVKNGGFENI